MGLIDLHAHILPGIDESLMDWNLFKVLLECYKAMGILHIVLTPHLKKRPSGTKVARIMSSYQKAAELSLSMSMKIDLASDVYFSDEGVREDFPLLPGNYALLDFPSSFMPINLPENLRLCSFRGFVVSHADRLMWLKGEMLETVRNLGGLFEVSGRSALTSARARKMLEDGVVDIISSDCYGNADDIEMMRDAIDRYPYVKKRMEALFTNT